MRAALLLAGILSLSVMSNGYAQVIYKWVDGDDVTHFGALPPEGVKAERTTIRLKQTNRRALRARIDSTAKRTAAVATRKKHEQDQAAENQTEAENSRTIRAENCEKARTRLLTYNTARRLYRPLEDGEREYLTDEELDSERMAAQQLVDEWCD